MRRRLLVLILAVPILILLGMPPASAGHDADPRTRNLHRLGHTGDNRPLGWEPGGGEEPECEANDLAEVKSIFFFDTATGALLGKWTLLRPQSGVENCTIHNYSIVPTAKRDVLTAGNYQAGTCHSY